MGLYKGYIGVVLAHIGLYRYVSTCHFQRRGLQLRVIELVLAVLLLTPKP